jgi:hypothetical protein
MNAELTTAGSAAAQTAAANGRADETLFKLRTSALEAHQRSVGRGDELVQILKRTIEQMEKSHSRVQNMSTILFGAGLLMLAVGVYMMLAGQGSNFWGGALLGSTGGVAALAATFWTAPLEKVSDSICDLVKLEAAFLGYIRVIGELDSAFQMQYLDILAGKSNLTLDRVMNDTTQQMKTIMDHTLSSIDTYVVGQGRALSVLVKTVGEAEKRIKALEDAKAK